MMFFVSYPGITFEGGNKMEIGIAIGLAAAAIWASTYFYLMQ
jgi:hypothetical protein